MTKAVFFALCCLLLLPGCKKDDGPAAPCTTLGIERVYPNNSPVGGPVLVKGTGFSDKTIVRFAREKAEILAVTQEYISVKVPRGLLGVVELSLDNGSKCITKKNFEIGTVTATNLPNSPPVYIIPPAGFAFPVQVGTDGAVTLTNLWQPEHTIELQFIRPRGGASEIEGREGLDDRFEGNEVTGEQNPVENKYTLVIDRSASGMPTERLEGGFYTLTMKVNGSEVTDNFFIAFSTVTGRQYVFRYSQ
jgi:hypothetical protein